jgi:hypothetical protein
MASPNRAPRRTAAQMSVNIVSGVPSPGSNTYQASRKTASASDGGAYNRQRSSAKVGLTPGNVSVNTDTSPQSDA